MDTFGMTIETPSSPEAEPTTEFEYVIQWLRGEYPYQYGRKFAHDENDRLVSEEGHREGTFWNQQLTNYWYRSQILGLDTINGRQAFAKFIATTIGLMESAVRVYGPLPTPGVTSGENLDNPMPPPTVVEDS